VTQPSAETIEQWLISRLARELKCSPDRIDLDRHAEGLGLDSIQSAQLCTELGDWLFGRELPVDRWWRAPTLRALCRDLAAGPEPQPTSVNPLRAPPEPVRHVAEAPSLPPSVRVEAPQEHARRTAERQPVLGGVGIEAIAYVLPEQRVSLEQLRDDGRITSDVHSLADMGFASALLSDVQANELARRACHKLLGEVGIDRERIGLLVNSYAVPMGALARGDRDWVAGAGGPGSELKVLTYSSCRLQSELGLVNARTLGISEMASMCLLGAVRAAQALMLLEEIDYALCVEADVFPPNCGRELVYNVVSDAACAVLLSRSATKNRLVAYDQITKGFYWDPQARQNEMISAYFVTARRAVDGCLRKAGMTLADVDLIIPANISRKSWDVFAGMLKFPIERVYRESITRQAHSVAADNYINFKDVLDAGRVKPGDVVLLFSFGVGAHWGCQLVII
jgi:3-oxoacyl-[acyl-carrier-protein] synthase-3